MEVFLACLFLMCEIGCLWLNKAYVDASLVRLTSFALLEPWGCVEVVRGVVRGVVREAVRKQNARGLS